MLGPPVLGRPPPVDVPALGTTVIATVRVLTALWIASALPAWPALAAPVSHVIVRLITVLDVTAGVVKLPEKLFPLPSSVLLLKLAVQLHVVPALAVKLKLLPEVTVVELTWSVIVVSG